MKIHIIIATLLLAFTCQAQPLVLSQKECRQMALTHSEDIKISSNNILQAELDRNGCPKLTFTAAQWFCNGHVYAAGHGF